MFDIPAPKSHNEQPRLPLVNLVSSSEKLEQLLSSQRKIAENKCKPISFSQPIVWQKENPVFFPKTINVIQGKAGVHKSRLAETICASLLKKTDCNNDLLGFKTNLLTRYAICYVDTERNLSEQLPYSLQQIQLKAGYEINEDPYGFDYISLLEFGREERFDMLNLYLEHARKKFPIHIFIILDVITDCVFNFNDTKDSMKLIDMMNQTINRYDVTFLCLIHENPGSADKARGHLGTEILNKASTVIQIGFEKDAQNHNTDLLKVAYLKCRSSKKHEPFYVQYSDSEKGLVMSDLTTAQTILDKKNHKAALSETLDLLAQILVSEMPRKELIELLTDELDCSKRTIISRLKQITDTAMVIEQNEVNHTLCTRAVNKEIVYYLNPLKSNV